MSVLPFYYQLSEKHTSTLLPTLQISSGRELLESPPLKIDFLDLVELALKATMSIDVYVLAV